MVNLAAMVAGNFESQGKPLNKATMGPVELYDHTEFMQVSGRRDSNHPAKRLAA